MTHSHCIETGSHTYEIVQHFQVTGFMNELEIVIRCAQCGNKKEFSGSVTADELLEKLGDNFYDVSGLGEDRPSIEPDIEPATDDLPEFLGGEKR